MNWSSLLFEENEFTIISLFPGVVLNDFKLTRRQDRVSRFNCGASGPSRGAFGTVGCAQMAITDFTDPGGIEEGKDLILSIPIVLAYGTGMTGGRR